MRYALALTLALILLGCDQQAAQEAADAGPALATTEQPAPPEVFVVVEEMPKLIGGLESLMADLTYPELARRAGIEGTVFVQLIVDKDGSVYDAEVVKGAHEALDAAALEAVRKARFEPGLQRGEPVRVRYALPVRFQLGDASAAATFKESDWSDSPEARAALNRAEQELRQRVAESAGAQRDADGVYSVAEAQPKLVGGLEALMEHIHYPEVAREAGIEGTVFVQFVVDEAGAVRDAEVVRGAHPALDAAALEAVRKAQFEPGQQRGKAVPVRFALPVRFKL